MPELPDLLAEEALRQQPAYLPPFEDIVRRTRRRRQVRAATLVAAAVVAVGAVSLAAATLQGEPRPTSQVAQDPTALPVANRTCRPTDLVLSLVWVAEPTGSLRGTLTATNPTEQACLLLVKPHVTPEGTDGRPLPANSVVTMEGRRGPDALLPGGTARATVIWFRWCGETAGRTASVTWPGEAPLRAAHIATAGPAQPSCPTRPAGSNELSSSWFEGLSASG